jgi:hypothetical protein
VPEDSNRFTHARLSQTLHFRPFEGFAIRRLTQCPQTALTSQPSVGTRWRTEAAGWLLMGWSQRRVSLISGWGTAGDPHSSSLPDLRDAL